MNISVYFIVFFYSLLDGEVIPERLCSCQQNCTERVTEELIKKVCVYFKSIVERNQQYKYLASLIQFKAKHNTIDHKSPPAPGKKFRQTGFRYFVPIISDEELKTHVEFKTELRQQIMTVMGEQGAKAFKICGQDAWSSSAGHNQPRPAVVNPTWDHVEVCLRAFVSIHLMSEKRVIITRQTRKLQKHVKCSKPLPSHANLAAEQGAKKKYEWDNEESYEAEDDKECDIEDVLRDVRVWMAEQADQARKATYPVNPRTMLPVGLVLPASVTCMPVYPKGAAPKPYLPQDQDRDVNIVSNFFSHQLWKPEYIGGVP